MPSLLTDWPGRFSLFFDQSKNTNFVEDVEFLLPVSSNSIQRFQRRSRKCLLQSEAGATILVSPIDPKTTNLVEDFKFLLPVKFRQIKFSSFRGEVENVKTDGQRTRHHNSALEHSAQVH